MGGGIGELEDLRHLDFGRTVRVAKENRDVVVGIKIRVPQDIVGQHGPQCLRLAKEISRTTSMPLMVHPGALPPNLSLIDILEVLEKGDIMTHIYPLHIHLCCHAQASLTRREISYQRFRKQRIGECSSMWVMG